MGDEMKLPRRVQTELRNLGPEAKAKHHHRWTAQDDKALAQVWGEFGLCAISRRLDRTVHAVAERAQRLGLGGGRHGLLRVRTIAEMTGYDYGTVKLAIQLLGLNMLPFPVCDPRQLRARAGKKRKAHRGIDEGDLDTLLEYFKNRKERQIVPRPGLKKGVPGAWGQAGRGDACNVCNRSDRPHQAKGKCANCYQAHLRAARKMPQAAE